MQATKIEWCDHTFNPWWGCTKVSPGCANCYAEGISARFGGDVYGKNKPRRTFDTKHWEQPIKWEKQCVRTGQRARVFCASMSDVFEDHPDVVTERQKLWELVYVTPMLDWLLLTKRPENILRMTPWQTSQWPENVWTLTSVENQKQADLRIPSLLDVPSSVRGLSVEPLLGEVDLSQWIHELQWVIVGGESGHGARPMSLDWVRSLRDQCVAAGVPFFFKQWGEWYDNQKIGKKKAGRYLDGRTWSEFPQITGVQQYEAQLLPGLATTTNRTIRQCH